MKNSLTRSLGMGSPVRKGKIKIKLSIIKNRSKITNFRPFSSLSSVFSWYPKARDKKGTEGLKWYKNMILGEAAQGNQKTRNPKRTIIKCMDLFLTVSQVVAKIAILPVQKTKGFPEAKILAMEFF